MQFSIQLIRNNYWYLGLYEKAFACNRENYQLMIKSSDFFAFTDVVGTNAAMNIDTGNYTEAAQWLEKLPDRDLAGGSSGIHISRAVPCLRKLKSRL